MKKILIIEGMTCNHCVMHVKNALEEVEGVKKVLVNLKNKMATIELSSSIDESLLVKAVLQTGYKVVEVQ